MSRRVTIQNTVTDLVANLFYYARKEDEDLPVGGIQEAVAAGEITVDEIVAQFADEVRKCFPSGGPSDER